MRKDRFVEVRFTSVELCVMSGYVTKDVRYRGIFRVGYDKYTTPEIIEMMGDKNFAVIKDAANSVNASSQNVTWLVVSTRLLPVVYKVFNALKEQYNVNQRIKKLHQNREMRVKMIGEAERDLAAAVTGREIGTAERRLKTHRSALEKETNELNSMLEWQEKNPDIYSGNITSFLEDEKYVMEAAWDEALVDLSNGSTNEVYHGRKMKVR